MVTPLVCLRGRFPTLCLVLGLLVTQPLAGRAQTRERVTNEPTPTASSIGVESPRPSIYDRLWAIPTIYQNKESDFFNELRLIGRLHLDAYQLDSNLGSGQGWIVRRSRLGATARFFHQLDLSLEVEFNLQEKGSAYRQTTNAYLAWKFSETLKLTAGKHSAPFTLDGATSSNELRSIDRNNLSNNVWFTADLIPGVSLGGKSGQWMYNTGIYSGGSQSSEFGDFEAGNFWLGSVGYDFAKRLGVKQALLRSDLVFNDYGEKSTFTRPFEQIGSIVFVLDNVRWGLSADLAAARGALTQGDVFGAVAMPWFKLTKKLELVGRYTFVASDQVNGVRFSGYERLQTTGRGDEYHEIYAGLNYFVYGHKLKFQTGLAYALMRDKANDGGGYRGLSWTSGVRISW